MNASAALTGFAASRGYLDELAGTFASFPHEAFARLLDLLRAARRDRRAIYLMGNGGSAATASHWVCDLLKGCSSPAHPRFRISCLNDNVPTLLAYANDLSYEHVFVEQLKNFVAADDVVIGISGSGNSPNVLRAIELGNERGAATVGLSGFAGGKLATLARLSLVMPIHDMQKVEDLHLITMHMLMQRLIADE